MTENNNKKRKTASKKGRKNKKLVMLMIVEGGLLLSLAAIYLFFGMYYQKHFFVGTTINGVNAANATVERAEAAINAQVKKYNLTLKERNGVSDIIYGENIDLHTEFESGLEELLQQQNGFLWPASLFHSTELTTGTMIAFDESLLKQYFNILNCFKEENIKEPVNASISEYGENGYEIIPEDPGAKVIGDKLYTAITDAITTLEPTISLEELGCYEAPKITSESETVKKALEEMNKIAGAKITYHFGDVTEILDGSKISTWLSVDKNDVVQMNQDGMKEYVDYIGKTYNTFGKRRTFQTSYGKSIKVEGGDYGWWLDRSSEVKELTELVKNGEQTERTPVYFQTAQQYGADDIGSTYVEVNLTAQHLFFYKEGELVLDTDFVSGNVSKNWGTPVGTYPVQYKENDATLVGEDYETPVKYWMPFNKNIGFHDANWRSDFGKDIYLTRGSHGCINMPPKFAKKMFENIKRGVAVVVYELPGTENYETKTGKATDKSSKSGTKNTTKNASTNTGAGSGNAADEKTAQ